MLLHFRHGTASCWRRARPSVTGRLDVLSESGSLQFTAGDARRCPRGFQDFFRRQVVCVCVAGLLSRQHPHAAAHGNALQRRLYQRLIHLQGSGRGVLKIEVGVIAAVGKRFRKVAFKVRLVESVTVEEKSVIRCHKFCLSSGSFVTAETPRETSS